MAVDPEVDISVEFEVDEMLVQFDQRNPVLPVVHSAAGEEGEVSLLVSEQRVPDANNRRIRFNSRPAGSKRSGFDLAAEYHRSFPS